jgi:hypothetical protein
VLVTGGYDQCVRVWDCKSRSTEPVQSMRAFKVRRPRPRGAESDAQRDRGRRRAGLAGGLSATHLRL